MTLNQLTIEEAHQGLKKRKFSTQELTKACLDQIKKIDDKIHAFNTVCKEEALNQAKIIDKKISEGREIGILTGIPLAIKDNICTQGIRTTCSSKMLENFIPPYDATVIKKLKEAGVILLGKTNMDEFAMGSSTENSYFGPTRNPHDLERVTGGSSGGSAAAVAAHMCIAALGSDTGGSIRQPASFCGVVGMKPTYGMVSRFGLVAMASSLDQIGPITKTVEDAEILLEIISGKNELDSTCSGPIFISTKDVKEIKIGVPKEYFIKGMDSEVEKVIKEGIKKLEKIGAEIIEISLPHTEYALAAYYLIMFSEVSANLAKYDGVRYGFSVLQSQVSNIKSSSDIYFKTRAEGFGNEVKRRIMLGTYALSAGYYDQYYLRAQKVRSLIKKDFDQVFEKVDVLVAPVSPTPAFKIGEKIDDPIKMYLSDVFTTPVNLAGLPAISVPCSTKGLPIGLQIIGKQFEDEIVLRMAKSFSSSPQ